MKRRNFCISNVFFPKSLTIYFNRLSWNIFPVYYLEQKVRYNPDSIEILSLSSKAILIFFPSLFLNLFKFSFTFIHSCFCFFIYFHLFLSSIGSSFSLFFIVPSFTSFLPLRLPPFFSVFLCLFSFSHFLLFLYFFPFLVYLFRLFQLPWFFLPFLIRFPNI